MDFDWSLSHFLDAANEVLSKRKTFLNVDPRIFYNVYINVMIFKCCTAGYGMIQVVPRKVTYAFLCLQFSLHFLIRDDWDTSLRETYAFLTHVSLLNGVEGYEEYVAWSLPFAMIWFFNCSFNPTEFFLDCYIFLVLICHLWKRYHTRPHKLSAMMCVLFTVNWVTDQFTSNEPTGTFLDMIVYYIPLLIMDSFAADNELHRFATPYGALWVMSKLKDHVWTKAPIGRYIDSLNIDGWSFADYLNAVGERKSFLNVNENEHYALSCILLLLKSFIASYAVINVIGVFPTLKMISANFLFAVCDRNASEVCASLIRTAFIGLFQYALHMLKYHISLSSGIWYFVACNNQFHFFLDFYLIISALIYIHNAYKGTSRIYSLLWFLYVIDWTADKCIGKPFTIIKTIATLYLPVALISSCTALSSRTRIFSMLVLIALWLVYKHDADNFEHCVNKCILNFYEIARNFAVNLSDALLE